MVVLYWGVEQFDRPAEYDSRAKGAANHLENVGAKPESKITIADFDMDELDSTIFEIESFINELDKKI